MSCKQTFFYLTQEEVVNLLKQSLIANGEISHSDYFSLIQVLPENNTEYFLKLAFGKGAGE